MYTTYFESKTGQADREAVKTLSREVSKIITEQVRKNISDGMFKKRSKD